VTSSTTGILVGPERVGGKLTPRERFRRTMHFQAVDRVLHREFGYWDSVKDRWLAEGHLPYDLPRNADGEISHTAVESFFGCDRMVDAGAPVGAGHPRPIEIVAEKDGKITYRDEFGILCEEVKEGIRSIPHFLEFPIKDRPTWEAFRDEFLVINDDWRVKSEQEIEAIARRLRSSEYPVGIHFGSFIGKIRDWVGFENLSYLTHDDPDLVEEMIAHLTELMLTHLPPYLDKIEYDYASGWEDIAFNSGPLVSPKTFRNIILPYMKPVMRMLRQHGIDVIYTDCDGNIGALLPLWLEVGLNCMFPVEIRAGNDPVQIRMDYGRDVLMLGGFDKFALLKSKEAILDELRRLEPVMRDGGFIPHVDHRCPDGVQFELYQYYIWEKCHFLGMPGHEIREIPGLAGM
jgi:uroporphyrinogen decarboxylase